MKILQFQAPPEQTTMIRTGFVDGISGAITIYNPCKKYRVITLHVKALRKKRNNNPKETK